MGFAITTIAALRRHCHAALSTSLHKSVAVEFALAGVEDPGVYANADVIYHWARARWDVWLSKATMDFILQVAIDKVKCDTPWASLAGPAAITVATAMRIGWNCISPTRWTDYQEGD